MSTPSTPLSPPRGFRQRVFANRLWVGLGVSALGIVMSVIDATASDVRAHGLGSVMLWAAVGGAAVLGAIGVRLWRWRRGG